MKVFNKIIISGILILTSTLALAKGLTIENPYVREVPPGQMISASFMTLKNDNNTEIALIKASSDVSKTVELHEHVHENGMMKMRPVPKIVIPANGITPLKPGGYHIMLIGLQRKIKAGDKIKLELEFDNGDRKSITATVKKIMQGMMKKGMKKDEKSAINEHINPMPNLMSVYKKMASKLSLSKDQITKLDAGIKERNPKVQQLTKTIVKLESDLKAAILNDDPLSKVDQLADKLMQNRLAMIQGKVRCRESIKEILDEEQFKTIVSLYRNKMKKKQVKMSEMQSRMAMIKHINPLPDLMQVVKKMADKLDLTDKQAADLKQWQDERDPIMEKQYKEVLKLEKELNEATLNNEPLVKIDQLADSIMQIRMRVARGTAFTRDNMKRILDDNQYKKVINLYKNNFNH